MEGNTIGRNDSERGEIATKHIEFISLNVTGPPELRE